MSDQVRPSELGVGVCPIRSVWRVRQGRVSLEVAKLHEAIPNTAHGCGYLESGTSYTIRGCRYCGCAFVDITEAACSES